VIAWLDALAVVAWLLTAGLAARRVRSARERALRPALLGLALASAAYSACMLAEWSHLTDRLEWLEDLIGATLPVWWLLLAFATEHRLHVEEVQQREAEMRQVFEQAFQLMGKLTTEGRLVTANSTALAMVGVGLDEVRGRLVWETPWLAHSAEERERVRQTVLAAAAGEFSRIETSLCDGEGDVKIIDFSVRPLRDPEGRVVALLAEGRDITDLRKAEHGRREVERELLQSQKMEIVGQLVGGVAHDFNNLLTAVAGSADLLRDKVPVRPDVEELFDTISCATEQGAALTRSILSFSQRTPSPQAVVDLRTVVERSTRLLRQLLPPAIRLVVATPEEPIWLRGDAVELQQLVLNLAINARDAMPGGGTLEVRIERPAGAPGERVIVVIKDTGEGIPAELQSQVFEPFFTTKSTRGGTGLGLAVVKRVVESHSGDLSVESAPGAGTVFRIAFPTLCEPPTDRTSGPDQRVAEASLTG
jgi:PAS domain S-box-containing protein